MLLDNHLPGMTIPGVVPQRHRDAMSKQMSCDLKSLPFHSESYRRNSATSKAYIGRMKCYALTTSILETFSHIDLRSIGREWGSH